VFQYLFDDTKNVVFPHNQVFFAFHLDFGAALFAEKHTVALFDFKGNTFAVISQTAVPDSDNLALGRLLFGRIGDDDPAFGFGLFFHALYQNSIV